MHLDAPAEISATVLMLSVYALQLVRAHYTAASMVLEERVHTTVIVGQIDESVLHVSLGTIRLFSAYMVSRVVIDVLCAALLNASFC
jgi:hypothetical protein